MLSINYLGDIDSEGKVILQHTSFSCDLLSTQLERKKEERAEKTREKGLPAGESIKKAHLAS